MLKLEESGKILVTSNVDLPELGRSGLQRCVSVHLTNLLYCIMRLTLVGTLSSQKSKLTSSKGCNKLLSNSVTSIKKALFLVAKSTKSSLRY